MGKPEPEQQRSRGWLIVGLLAAAAGWAGGWHLAIGATWWGALGGLLLVCAAVGVQIVDEGRSE